MRFFEGRRREESRVLLPHEVEAESPLAIKTWKTRAVPIAMGQAASIMLCLSGVFTMYLNQFNLQSPGLQNWTFYAFLGLIFMPWLAICPPDPDESFKQMFQARGWKYFLIAASDAGGNYFVNLAYEYTSLTSVQLLSSFSVPTVLGLSYMFLRARYTRIHYAGVVVCLLGVAFLIWADFATGRDMLGLNIDPVFGDLLCLAAAIVYGLSNVSQEFFVKNFSPYEFLGFVGFFGCIVSALLGLVAEDFTVYDWTMESVSALLGYGAARFWYYVIVAVLMVQSNCLAITLAMLSAGFYSVLIGVFAFDFIFSALYILAFVLMMVGIGMFSLRPVLHNKKTEKSGPFREAA